MNAPFRHLAESSAVQHGVVTSAQVAAAGVTPDVLRRQVRSGVLERVGVRTYRSPFVRSTALVGLAGLLFDLGPDAFACGPTAAALHGFDGFKLRPPFHAMVVRGRNPHRVGHHVHTTIDLPRVDRATVLDLPVLSATRTLIDLARHIDAPRLTAALDSALRDGLTAEHALHRRIVELRSSGRYGIPRLLDVIEGLEATRGGHSWLERRFLELCAQAGLRLPRTQVELARAGGRMVRVDCWFEPGPVVVELLGYRWHRTVEQMSRDAARANALVLAGKLPLQFTYEQLTVDGPGVVAEVAGAIQRFV